MSYQRYKKQVALLLDILPIVSNEKSFALHGGTAINLFIRNMPRLSVDIDLSYIPIENRDETLKNISNKLEKIESNIKRIFPNIKIQNIKNKGRLLIEQEDVSIKIEVNLIKRGLINAPIVLPLCKKAQEEFDTFIEIQAVPFGQLYGGKICAALDRQHPRDFFDIKYLFNNEGITNEIKKGFIFNLISSNRPLYEIVSPNLQDSKNIFENQFTGMSSEKFTYEDFKSTQKKLLEIITSFLSPEDKEFLIDFSSLNPNWNLYDFSNFPSVKWKLKNLKILKEQNREKFELQLIKLKELFYF